MRIQIAKTAGFCMGVRRAVEMVLDAPLKYETPIYTYGPLIHNPQVLNLLAEKGITVLNDIPEAGRGTVLVRAHGVPPDAVDKLKESGFKVIDATCPRVIKVQTIIQKHAGKGYETIIIGDGDHPEVIGLLGYAGDCGHVAATLKELAGFPVFEKAIIVAQTTQNTRFYEEVRAWVAAHAAHYKIFDTICDSTEKRQEEVKQLAEMVDAVVVVGGKSSGNTKRLAEIAGQKTPLSFHVETENELDLNAIASVNSVGITAGASTPNWIIKRIYRTLENLPYSRYRGWRRSLFFFQRNLLLTNIYVSLGAGALCYACCKLLSISNPLPFVFISVMYVQSMHILNHLTGRKADQYNDPERAFFYDIYKWPLTALAMIAGAAGLLTAFAFGPVPFLILAVMSFLGLSYNLEWIPKSFTRIRCRRIRDIPGSKTILIATAWGVVTSLLPAISAWGRGGIDMGAMAVFSWATGVVFVRTAFFDVMDMQGDRIVGKETLPILMGAQRTLFLLKTILTTVLAVLLIAGVSGIISKTAFALVFSPVFLFYVLKLFKERRILPGIRLEFLVETHFILCGMIALMVSWL